VLVLSALILGGGLIPQPGVASRYRAAIEIIARRQATLARFEQRQDSPRTADVGRRIDSVD